MFAAPQLAALELCDCYCNLKDDLEPGPLSTSITSLKIDDCKKLTAFLVALPELRHLELCADNENHIANTVEEVNTAFSSLHHLTYVSLSWRRTVPPASLTHLTNMRRLRLHYYTFWFPEGPEGGRLPPPGAWSSGLQKLSIMGYIAFRSLDTLRRMPALQHLRLYCCTAEYDLSDAAWTGLLEAAAASNLQLQRLDIVKAFDENVYLDTPDSICGILLRLQRTHPRLAIAMLSQNDGAWKDWDA